jgi:glycosyltransferase involved in cell wall biosynthesis
MKILFVHPGYWPYMAATNRALFDLTKYLADNGNEVHVICSGPNPKEISPNAPTNLKIYEGIHIHRVRVLNIPLLKIDWRSPLSILKFFLQAGITTLYYGREFDIVVTLDLPPVMGIWGNIIQLITLGKTRHVCWMMDMITESRFELGIWKLKNLRHTLIHYFHILPYRHAALCIVLGQCMSKRLIKHHIEPSKIKVIGIWHYSTLIQPLPVGTQPTSFNENLLGKFIVMYSGYASSAHSFEAIQKAMYILQDDNRIHFVLVGDSDKLLELESFAKTSNLNNCTRLNPVSWDELGSLLAGGNVHLVTLKEELTCICVPSKLYGIMAAGRPVIFIGPQDSQSAKDVLESSSGFVISTSDSCKLSLLIRELTDDIGKCNYLGSNAYNSFISKHEYSVVCEQWVETLENLLKDKQTK